LGDSEHWETVSQQPDGNQNGCKFGNCIAMHASRKLIAVSAPDVNDGKGHVKIFGFDGLLLWNQVRETYSVDKHLRSTPDKCSDWCEL
jgi:hypothetical protein